MWRFDPPAKEDVIDLDEDEDPTFRAMNIRTVAEIATASAGVSLSFHKSDLNHIMVAEKRGVIRLFNWSRRDPTWEISLYGPSIDPIISTWRDTLHSADWMAVDPRRFAALIGAKWYMWNIETTPGGAPSDTGDVQPTTRDPQAQPPSAIKLHPTDARVFAIATSGQHPLHIHQSAFPQVPNMLNLPRSSKGRIVDIAWLSSNTIACAAGHQIVILTV